MKFRRVILSLLAPFLLATLFPAGRAAAWEAQGHKLIGSVADQALLLTPHARQRVADILGISLQQAATWPDCVRNVQRHADGSFVYAPLSESFQKPCLAFATAADKRRMVDYARRNWTNCADPPPKGCHTAYHFTDIAIQRDRYDRAFKGTGDDDIVAAINAAILVLQGKPAPAPFSIRGRKEALLLLAHLVGDVHQPLHVGSIYLDPVTGAVVDPDIPGAFNPKTATRGGNSISERSQNMHSEWDDLPDAWGIVAPPAMVDAAKAVPPSAGPVGTWAVQWAGETVLVSRQAFQGLSFARDSDGKGWEVTIPDRVAYTRMRIAIQRAQLAKAGARLAQLLNAVWD